MGLELTRVGLLVELANHYTTRGTNEGVIHISQTQGPDFCQQMQFSVISKTEGDLPHLQGCNQCILQPQLNRLPFIFQTDLFYS